MEWCPGRPIIRLIPASAGSVGSHRRSIAFFIIAAFPEKASGCLVPEAIAVPRGVNPGTLRAVPSKSC